jgi:hypothetical protein
MKKRLVVLTTVLTLTAGIIAGCGAESDPAQPQSTQPEAVQEEANATEAESTESAEQEVGLANPWVTITEDEAKELCTRLFKAPEGATDVEWLKCEDLGDPEKSVGPLVQLSFKLDDLEFTARAQHGAAEDADIAGN